MRETISIGVLFIYLVVMFACISLDAKEVALRQEGPHFDHAGHLERGVECIDCHGEEDGQWMAMPELEFCMECHEEIDSEKEPELRADAFYDAEGVGNWVHGGKLAQERIFDHATHVNAVEGECLSCHASVAESKAITPMAKMSMDDCTSCHEEAAPAANECASCHREIRRDAAPPSHRVAFLKEHGRIAREGDLDEFPTGQCAWCHQRSDCDECHKSELPRDHNNLFRMHGHAAAANMDRHRCDVCHTTDSCFLCHQQTEPRNHRGLFGSPFNRHCNSCHIPTGGGAGGGDGCAVCHKDSVGHEMAPPRPMNAPHMTNDSGACRECHTPLQHPDNGQSCLLCHK